jgi:hypothetical protein
MAFRIKLLWDIDIDKSFKATDKPQPKLYEFQCLPKLFGSGGDLIFYLLFLESKDFLSFSSFALSKIF